MGWTLHMTMCVLLCYPVSIHMSQLLSTGRPISSLRILRLFILSLIIIYYMLGYETKSSESTIRFEYFIVSLLNYSCTKLDINLGI